MLLLIVQPLQVLLHRTGEGTEGGRRKAERPQHLQHCALSRLMYQQQKILLLRRQGYLYQLRRLFLQSVFCLLEIRPQGHGAGDHRQLAAAVQLQRHVQLRPRLQRQPLGLNTLKLGGQLLLAGRMAQDLRCQRLLLPQCRLIQKLTLADAGAGGKQSGLFQTPAAQRRQRRLHLAGGLPPANQLRRFRMQQHRPVRVRRQILRLPDLQPTELQQRIHQGLPLLLHRQQVQPLHFHNGHYSCTTLLRMVSTA